MPALTRLQERAKQLLAHAASSSACPLGGPQPHHQSFLNNLPWKEVSIVVIGHLEVVLLLWLQSRLFPCPALIRENPFFSSNTISGKYFAIDTKPDEIHCKIQNHIYLLICTHCGIESNNVHSEKREIRM